MRTFTLREAETHLSRLVEEAAGGEAFVIARAGKPLVKVVAIDAPVPKPGGRLGFLAGRFEIPEDFNRIGGSEIAALFGVDE